MSRNGDVYEVVLDGARVLDGSLTLGVPPVVVSMPSGEHKHCGFKTTQCVVNILTDVPMVDLYAQKATDVRLTVNNVTHAGVVFDGYVLPFVFDQSYTGKADMFSVNAVDVLTARKGVKYQNETGWSAPQPWGTDRTAHEIVTGIAARAGIYRVVEHLNFNGTTDKMQDDSPLNVKVAQAGFLQDGVSELDALSAICKFFGYTACLRGDTLWLYDEYCLLNAADGKRTNCNVYVMGRLEQHFYDDPLTMMYDTVVGDVVRNDISVTIERAYDGVQITADGSDVSMLLPNVCGSEYMEENDGNLGTNTRTYTGSGYVQYRTPIKSKLMRMGKTEGGELVDFPNLSTGDWMKPNANDDTYWMEGAIPIKYVQVAKSYTDDEGTEVESQEASKSNMVWMRAATDSAFVAEQISECSYSHTGGYVELGISYRRTNRTNWQMPEGDNLLTSETRIKFLQLKSGDKYLVKSGRTVGWGDTIDAPMYVKDNKLRPTDEGMIRYDNRFVAKLPNDGQVRVELRGRGSAAVASDYYIESLYIKGVGDDINTSHADMQHKFTTGDEYMDVSILLTSRKSGAVHNPGEKVYGVNARPGVVTSEKWNGGYMGRASSEAIPMSGVLMEQLKARYREPRVCYKMTVSGQVRPYAAVYWAGTGHTVEAYDWDIYEDKTTVTID